MGVKGFDLWVGPLFYKFFIIVFEALYGKAFATLVE